MSPPVGGIHITLKLLGVFVKMDMKSMTFVTHLMVEMDFIGRT